MGQYETEISLEYEYLSSPDAEERLAEAHDFILGLILKELEISSQDGEPCSTPSE